jgi:hypothetical protein
VKGAAASGATVAKAKSGASSSHQQGSEEEEEFWSLIAPLELAANPPDPQDRVTVQTLPAGEPLHVACLTGWACCSRRLHLQLLKLWMHA